MIEKIDIIETTVYCYNQDYSLIKVLDISQFQNINLPHSNEYKLYSINITNPIKRVINFSELNDINHRAEFTEYLYNEMSLQEKTDLDNFIQQAENL